MKNYLYLLIVLFCSCNNPTKVTIVSDISAGPNTIVFDNKDTVIATKVIDSIFLSPFRKHTFTVNNSKPQDFFLRDLEGILNVSKKEFVVLETEYESESGEGERFSGGFTMDSYVLIDSFLVCNKAFEIEDKTKLKAIVDSIKTKKNGNYYPFEDDESPSATYGYDSSESVNGFKKIGNKNLFIEKFWDYNFGDSIPREIAVSVRESDLQYKNRVKKTLIIFADHFLLFARMSKKKYAVVDVRDLLKGKIDNHKIR